MLDNNALLAAWELQKGTKTRKEFAKMHGMKSSTLPGKLARAKKKRGKRELVGKSSYPPVLMRAAIFDIETTDFTTGGIRDHLICASLLPLDSDDVTTLSIKFRDKRNDRKLLKEIVKEMNKYDLLIGHNIAAFDFNWLNSRLMYHNLPNFSKRWIYYDTYQAAKRLAIKSKRKSLVFLCDYFKVPYVKTSIYPVSWGMIDSPREAEFTKAVHDIVYHCEEDVKSNRELFFAMWPRDRGLMNLPTTRKW
jgi:uncharacterized protein YprB with RNaseH-like and TPR domain